MASDTTSKPPRPDAPARPPAPHADFGTWGSLMAAAQAGDRTSYTRLLAAVTPYLRAIARRSLRAPEDVEDAVQDVLLTIHQIRHTYDPSRPFAPWLVTITRRRIIDRIRVRSRLLANEVGVDLQAESFAAIEPVDAWAPDQDYSELLAAIRELPPGQRQAVELLKLKELSLKEASAASGLSVGALKVAGHRAYKALRVALSGKKE